MEDVVKKIPQSATLVGPEMGRTRLFHDRSGLVFDNDTVMIAGGKRSLTSVKLQGDSEYQKIIMGTDAPYVASEEQCQTLGEKAKNALWTSGTIYTNKELSYLKHHEMKQRLTKEIKDVSSKSVLIDLLEEHLQENFNKEDIQPFSYYREALLSKMTETNDGRRWLIQGALEKLDEMESGGHGKAESVAYLKKAVMHKPNAKYENQSLDMNEYLIVPDERHLKGILVARGDEACALDFYNRFKSKGIKLPFYAYDQDAGSLTNVEKPTLRNRSAKKFLRNILTKLKNL